MKAFPMPVWLISLVTLSFAVSGAIARSGGGATTSARVSRSAAANNDAVDEDEPWKADEDWWKDPFSMFDDEEEEEEEEEEQEEVAEEEEEAAVDFAELGEDDDELDTVVEANMTLEPEEEMDDELMILTEGIVEPAIISKEPTNKPAVASPTRKGSVKSSSGAPLVGVLSVIPKLFKKSVPVAPFSMIPKALKTVPVVPVISTAIVAKVMVDFVSRRTDRAKDSQRAKLSNNELMEEYPADMDEPHDFLEEEMKEEILQASKEDYPSEEVSTEEQPDLPESDETTLDKKQRHSLGVPNVFQAVGNRFARPVGRNALMKELEQLRTELKHAQNEREYLEQEYEHASLQLQDTQAELSKLTSTTRYLKAQLRDNEEVMNRTIRAERSKAKAELTKMKDAMLRVLEKERRSMREELKRQTGELQDLLEASGGEGGDQAMGT